MRNWFCRTFHHLGQPISGNFRCLDCGNLIPIRTGLADAMIRDNLRSRQASDAASETIKEREFSTWWKKEIGG